MLLSTHFTEDDFARASSGGAIPDEFLPNARALATVLQAIRDLIHTPIRIVTFWRSVGAEIALGIPDPTPHVRGHAVLCETDDVPATDILAAVETAKAYADFPAAVKLAGLPETEFRFLVTLPDPAPAAVEPVEPIEDAAEQDALGLPR